MALEDKLDDHIKVMSTMVEAMHELSGLLKAGGTAPAAETKSGRKTKDAAPVSKHTADDIKAAFDKAKVKVGAPPLKKLIGDLGATGLADLLAKTELFDKAMAGIEALDTPEPDDDL